MGTGLNLDLRHDFVLDHLGDDAHESITRRLGAGLIRTLFAGDFYGKPGQFNAVKVTATSGTDGGLDSARVGPSAHGVRAHPQQFGGLSDTVLPHPPRLPRSAPV